MMQTLGILFLLIISIASMTTLITSLSKRLKEQKRLKKISSLDIQVFLDLPNINEYVRTNMASLGLPYSFMPWFYKDNYGNLWYLNATSSYLYWDFIG